MRYHPIDIETSLLRTDRRICEWFPSSHFPVLLSTTFPSSSSLPPSPSSYLSLSHPHPLYPLPRPPIYHFPILILSTPFPILLSTIFPSSSSLPPSPSSYLPLSHPHPLYPLPRPHIYHFPIFILSTPFPILLSTIFPSSSSLPPSPSSYLPLSHPLFYCAMFIWTHLSYFARSRPLPFPLSPSLPTSPIPTLHPPPSSAVFTWTHLLVVVVELDGPEQDALDLIALVTSTVLEQHYLVVGVVVVVDPQVIPINSRGEKQRMHLRDGFLSDQLDPIYVAYNMWTRQATPPAPPPCCRPHLHCFMCPCKMWYINSYVTNLLSWSIFYILLFNAYRKMLAFLCVYI